jgi:hypothetical protein
MAGQTRTDLVLKMMRHATLLRTLDIRLAGYVAMRELGIPTYPERLAQAEAIRNEIRNPMRKDGGEQRMTES